MLVHEGVRGREGVFIKSAVHLSTRAEGVKRVGRINFILTLARHTS
jgi:hypothetical protein